MKVKQSDKNYSIKVDSKAESLLEVLLSNKVDISHSCGGNGTCGTCRVKVLKGVELFPPRNELEEEMAEDRCFNSDERLSCQNPPLNEIEILIPS